LNDARSQEIAQHSIDERMDQFGRASATHPQSVERDSVTPWRP
jgi:hypothetical protein